MAIARYWCGKCFSVATNKHIIIEELCGPHQGYIARTNRKSYSVGSQRWQLAVTHEFQVSIGSLWSVVNF